MIKIHNLKKNYGKFTALDGVSFELNAGEIFGLIGPNGAGKTTTIKILCGLLKADAGEIYFEDQKVDERPDILKRNIGYVPDFFGTYEKLKVMEYLEFYAGTYGIRSKEANLLGKELLERVGLSEFEDYFVNGLSRGMKQRLCLARALIHDPKLLIMDEPASGMDPGNRKEFREILHSLKNDGKTIIISSHILSELAESCTHVGILNHGKMVVSGSMKEIESKWAMAAPLIVKVTEGLGRAVEVMKAVEEVRSISILEDTILITFTGDAQQESQLLTRLIQSGVSVRSFAREESFLEALFMEIT